MVFRILGGALGAIGLLISVYFALIFNGALRPDSPFLPKLCRMEQPSCTSILQSRDARLLGIQNFYPGMLYYTLILFWTFESNAEEWFLLFMKIAAAITVVAGIYLTSSLLFRLRITCVLCLASHVINFLLFLLMILNA